MFSFSWKFLNEIHTRRNELAGAQVGEWTGDEKIIGVSSEFEFEATEIDIFAILGHLMNYLWEESCDFVGSHKV